MTGKFGDSEQFLALQKLLTVPEFLFVATTPVLLRLGDRATAVAGDALDPHDICGRFSKL